MKTLVRNQRPDADYFITAATSRDRPTLLDDVSLFFESWSKVDLKAWVLFQDHFHAILNAGNRDVCALVRLFRVTYSMNARARGGSGCFWHCQFWCHMISDDSDFLRHLDYVHFNPVYHDICRNPFEYPFSSLTRWYRKGLYPCDWGRVEVPECAGYFGEW